MLQIFNHKILGKMEVYGDQKGLWFRYDNVIDALCISKVRADFKCKQIDDTLKQDIMLETLDGQQLINFIHEKALYQLMAIGNSKYCRDFQKWIGEIASKMDILNLHTSDNHANSKISCDYENITTYFKEMKPESEYQKSVKESFERFDDEIKKINWIIDKEYDPEEDEDVHCAWDIKELEDIKNKRFDNEDLTSDELKKLLCTSIDNEELEYLEYKLKNNSEHVKIKQIDDSRIPSWLYSVIK